MTILLLKLNCHTDNSFLNYVHNITLCTINIHYFTKRKSHLTCVFKVFTIFNLSEKKNSKYILQQVALFEGLQVVLCVSTNTSLGKASP